MRRFPKKLRICLFVLAGVAGIVLVAALALLLFVDVDAYKPRVEATASKALAMEVTVEGPLRIGFIPGPHITLEKVRVRHRGTQIAFVEEAELAIEFLSLFQQGLRYGNIALNRARISIERGRDGRYNYEKSPEVIKASGALDLPKVSFSDLIVAYSDKASGGGFESRNCNGELINMRHPAGVRFLNSLSVSGQFACGELQGKDTKVSDLKFSVEATDGVFDFKPVTMRVFGGKGSGSLHMDRAAEVPVLQLSFSLPRFRIEEFFRGLPPGKSVSGLMDFSTTLSMRGRTRIELRRSAGGEMSLSGTNLTLAGVDLDKNLENYESSQSFNLFDLSALLLAGPIGLAVTKGYEFSNLVHQPGGSTEIRTFVSKWRVEKGVAHAKDVALATRANRLALRGGLDFVDDEFDEVFVTQIDSDGCARVRQRIRGPFNKPVVEKPSVLATLAGPVLNLFGKARDAIPGTGGKCEVFYAGSVAPPK